MYVKRLLGSLCLGLILVWMGPVFATELTQKYEKFLLGKLAIAQQPPARLAEFSSDGCSGGLSDAWAGFATLMPLFRERYGDKPPWEHCCVAHDRVYWRGETEDGFEKRKQADLALKQCVIETGQRLKKGLVAQYDGSEAKMMDGFSVAANLIYGAVRVGGQPCSIFPWRWGYGWPICSVFEQ